MQCQINMIQRGLRKDACFVREKCLIDEATALLECQLKQVAAAA